MKEKNIKKNLFKLIGIFMCLSALSIVIPTALASDYFVYSELSDSSAFSMGGSYGPDGYVGSDGINRIIFYRMNLNSATAYIYKVTIPPGSDPNMHPDNPNATGPIAPRTFTLDKTFNLGVNPSHESEFYVDTKNNTIYLGASVGIRKYVYDQNIGNYVFSYQIAPASPDEEGYSTQSLAYDPSTNTWYAGSIAWNDNPGSTQRDVWKYDASQGSNSNWVLAFKYTTPGIITHHDGMEFIKGYLYLADYQGDYIYQYSTSGNLINKFTHEPLGHELEGMGFGALEHFWVGSHDIKKPDGTFITKITEFGGGALQAAVTGIPDQCAATNQEFNNINLDNYAAGTKPFTWSYSGNDKLQITIVNNIATIKNPSGFTGSETITFTVKDANGNTASDDVEFTVDPVPKVIDIPDQNSPFTDIHLDNYLTGIDASKVSWIATGNDKLDVIIDPVTHIAKISNPLNSKNSEIIKFTAKTTCCNRNVTSSDSATFTPNNPPTAEAGGPYTVDEGSSITLNGVGTDVDNDTLTYQWDLNNDGTFEIEGQSTSISPPDGPVSLTASFKVSDGKDSAVDTAIINVNNIAPKVDPISVSSDLVSINTQINAKAMFSDPGILDTHTAEWNWGDGTTTTGTLTETNGSGNVADNHTYTQPGVYTIILTVTDKDNASGSSVYQYVVVYDPNAGFVTGGGSIISPAGAYKNDTTLTGQANFGFVSKYQKGANKPTGQTEFQFKLADLNFHSTSYDWLVVAGARAQYKGTGTINNKGNYGFLLTAVDGQVNSGNDVDKFRIKIWDISSDNIVYDNAEGSDDISGSPVQAINSGSIVIHK